MSDVLRGTTAAGIGTHPRPPLSPTPRPPVSTASHPSDSDPSKRLLPAPAYVRVPVSGTRSGALV